MNKQVIELNNQIKELATELLKTRERKGLSKEDCLARVYRRQRDEALAERGEAIFERNEARREAMRLGDLLRLSGNELRSIKELERRTSEKVAERALGAERELARAEELSKIFKSERDYARQVKENMAFELNDAMDQLRKANQAIKDTCEYMLGSPPSHRVGALLILGRYIENGAGYSRTHSTPVGMYICAGDPGKEIHQATCGVQPGDAAKRESADVSGTNSVSVQEATEGHF